MMAVCGATVEKMATEVRNLQRTEIAELEEPFGKKQKGSSAMPHKRNPVVCEQLSGLARVLRGNAVVALQNVALWHERDISHSSTERVIIPDSTILLDYMLNKMHWVISNMRINSEQMSANLERTRGLLFSQKVLLALVDKGLVREVAYEYVQRNAMKTWLEGGDFRDNLLNDRDVSKHISAEELDKIMDYSSFLKYVDEIYRQCGLDT
jgi:adenylosuccinate lyase